jgi:hypothetical protein
MIDTDGPDPGTGFESKVFPSHHTIPLLRAAGAEVQGKRTGPQGHTKQGMAVREMGGAWASKTGHPCCSLLMLSWMKPSRVALHLLHTCVWHARVRVCCEEGLRASKAVTTWRGGERECYARYDVDRSMRVAFSDAGVSDARRCTAVVSRWLRLLLPTARGVR